MTTKTVKAEVDLDQWEDGELISEIVSRGHADPDSVKERGTALYYAFQFKNDDEAIKIARQLAEDITGRII